MAQANDTEAIIHQNLVDAGCDEPTIQRCMLLVKSGKLFNFQDQKRDNIRRKNE